MIPEGERDAAHGELIEYIPKNHILEYEFDMLVCDEAQFVRRESGSYHNLLRLTNWRRLLHVTGTPIASLLRAKVSLHSSPGRFTGPAPDKKVIMASGVNDTQQRERETIWEAATSGLGLREISGGR
ncbi:hypothetical protein ACHAPJ_003148 [Fusarium lateritium]